MTLRRLSFEELAVLYAERIVEDFPPGERRPLSSMEKLHRRGRYVCLGLEQGERLAAYAAFICDPSLRCVLLDYFAVDCQQRGNGIGSAFLGMITEYWADEDGIIIECEAPEAANSAEEKDIRERRIAFYLRGGAAASGLSGRLFGVDYRMLWLPIQAEYSAAQVREGMLSLYAFAAPALVRCLFIRLKVDGEREIRG